MRLGTALKVVVALAFVSAGSMAALPGAFGEDDSFYCEVLSVDGPVFLHNAKSQGKALSEGDLLAVDDEVETGEGGTADLAFDKDWSNVTRIEEKSRMQIREVFPTRLYLEKGALYAKLKSLPKDSVFQVETPTAIAAVRGTEYRTEYADGETSVSNDSEAETSKVYLYDPNADGDLEGEPAVLPRAQFTGVRIGGKPRPPQPMPAAQKQFCEKARGVLDRKIRENEARGRVGKIQDLHKMEAFGRKLKERGIEPGRALRRDERFAGGPGNPPGGSGPGSDRGPRDGQSFDGGRRADGQPGGFEGKRQDGFKPLGEFRPQGPGNGQFQQRPGQPGQPGGQRPFDGNRTPQNRPESGGPNGEPFRQQQAGERPNGAGQGGPKGQRRPNNGPGKPAVKKPQ